MLCGLKSCKVRNSFSKDQPTGSIFR